MCTGFLETAGISTMKKMLTFSEHLLKYRKSKTLLQHQQTAACSSSLIDSSLDWGSAQGSKGGNRSILSVWLGLIPFHKTPVPSSPLASSLAWVECRGIWWQTGSPYCTSAEIPEPDSIRERCHPWPGQAYLCACSLRNKDVNKHCYPHRSSTVISIRQRSDRKPRPVFFPAMPLPLTPAARAWGDFLY